MSALSRWNDWTECRTVVLHDAVSCRCVVARGNRQINCGFAGSCPQLFGRVVVLTRRRVAQILVTGYYCVAGTTAAAPCGSAAVYCPPGSAAPMVVLAGYFSAGGANVTVQNQQNQCPSGSYCFNGTQYACPAGTYRAIVGASSIAGCVVCPAGFFCGSSTSSPVPCGPDSVGDYSMTLSSFIGVLLRHLPPSLAS